MRASAAMGLGSGGDELFHPRGAVTFVADRAPGVALTAAIAYAAEVCRHCHKTQLPVVTNFPLLSICRSRVKATAKHTTGLSPLLWASLGGIIIGTTLRALDGGRRTAAMLDPGVTFAKARLLRMGIVLYGAKLTVQKILGIGAAGFLADLYSVGSTLTLGFGLGRALGLADPLTALISTGSAICGCSAVAATQPIVEAEPHEASLRAIVFVSHPEGSLRRLPGPLRRRSRRAWGRSCCAGRQPCSFTQRCTRTCPVWRRTRG